MAMPTMARSRTPFAADGTVRMRLHVHGAVQGVGFRPFVHRLAHDMGISGHVVNTPAGVVIEAEGGRDQLQVFLLRLERERPPLSQIDHIATEQLPVSHARGFRIRESERTGPIATRVLPDIAVCPECLREMRDPSDRRYRYPFINCTHCGPRYSIMLGLPYDRPNTTMAGFPLCGACRAEYEDPGDRRFHAQPLACPECGPQLALWTHEGRVAAACDEALAAAAAALRDGAIVAVKGLGGFHLMTDAANPDAIAKLRVRKRREAKPFALLVPDCAAAARVCRVSPLEESLLRSIEAPIVLLDRRDGAPGIAPEAAPGLDTLGIMLPSNPLHHLLAEAFGGPLIATSGNLSNEPMCFDERDALRRLGHVADWFLVHDRPIARPVDDSIVQVAAGQEMALRRARGYAPLPIVTRAGADEPPSGTQRRAILAAGAHQKSTVALALGREIYLSQHIGDLEHPESQDNFVETQHALQRLYGAAAEAYACDTHPDYPSARFARASGLPCVAVQHHHAHVLACMAEHGLDGPVLGVAWDGSGHGPDGTVWGGEFLRVAPGACRRVAHLRTFPLPGGERAILEPRRTALGMLHEARAIDAGEIRRLAPLRDLGGMLPNLRTMLDRGVNSPRTSSAGRLFDAAAAILGLCQSAAYEGQGAMLLEQRARRAAAAGPAPRLAAPVHAEGVLDWEPLVMSLARLLHAGETSDRLAFAFHHALAKGILETVCAHPSEEIVLTGGCFQNRLLTELTVPLLRGAGFQVFWHRRVPPNDGGIALGQAFHALHTEGGAEACA